MQNTLIPASIIFIIAALILLVGVLFWWSGFGQPQETRPSYYFREDRSAPNSTSIP